MLVRATDSTIEGPIDGINHAAVGMIRRGNISFMRHVAATAQCSAGTVGTN